MTVTENDAPSAVTTPAGATSALAPPPPASGFAALLGTGDHKTIGRLWITTSFVFLLVAGVSGGVLGIERIDVIGIDVLDGDVFAQVFSLHAVAGVYLFLVPLLLGLATYVVPLQVGASTIAFPRAAAASYWTYLLGGGTVLAAYLADGGPFGGDSDAVELFIAAMVAVLIALTMATVCVATTGLALRAPGMGLHRAPLFTWANIVAATLWVLTLPLLAGILVLVYIDHRYGQTFLGGSDQVLQRMAWSWSQPSVAAFAIPVLGIVGDVVPVFARTRITMHRIAMGAIGVFGAVSFGAWAMPGFAPRNSADLPLNYVDEVPFVAFPVLGLFAALAFTGLLADTLRRGSLKLASPLLWGISALLMLLTGMANGVLVSIDPLDLVGTTAMAAQVHYVLVATLLGAFGGVAYWAPKIWGRTLAEGASKALAAGGLLGTIGLCLPDLVSGFLDQVNRFGGASDNVDAIEALNLVSVAGGGLLIVVALGFLVLVGTTAMSGADAGDDPWEGHTIEWATTSPPPVANFAEVPAITSEAPVYDARHAGEADS